MTFFLPPRFILTETASITNRVEVLIMCCIDYTCKDIYNGTMWRSSKNMLSYKELTTQYGKVT